MSHSAGGIIASTLADDSNIFGIICFGYPFKHPDKGEERYRTKFLKDIKKPFLVIQGTKDEYGGADVQNRYKLSPYIEFEFVEATHEYENLSGDDWARVAYRIECFLQAKTSNVKWKPTLNELAPSSWAVFLLFAPSDDLLPQTGQLWDRKSGGVVELQNDLANIAGGRSPSDECGLKQL